MVEDIYIPTTDGNQVMGDVYIPTRNTGNVPSNIKESEHIRQTRGMSIGGHVILIFLEIMLTR